jgi:hypothetical protein
MASNYTDPHTPRGDTYAVSQRFWEFSAIFASPVRLVIALTFLYQYVLLSLVLVLILRMCGRILGWSALSGVVVVLVAYALNYPLAKYNIDVCDVLLIGRSNVFFNTDADYSAFLESERSKNGCCQRASPEYPLLEILWLGSVYMIELPAGGKPTCLFYTRGLLGKQSTKITRR